jgi:hypothetical protein
MENLILIIFLVLVICFMFLMIMNKQQQERTYIKETNYLVPYYRWWYGWWPYYGSGSSTYYNNYRYPHRKPTHRRHREHRRPRINEITIIADKSGKSHVASRSSIIPTTVSGRVSSISGRIKSRIKNSFNNIHKIKLLRKSKNAK